MRDLHRETAAKLLNKKPEDVTPDERLLGKTANHMAMWGGKIEAIKIPWRNRFAFQTNFAIRFDESLFKWDCTWHEKRLHKNQNALWWPRFNVAFCGVQFGIALWIGKGVVETL